MELKRKMSIINSGMIGTSVVLFITFLVEYIFIGYSRNGKYSETFNSIRPLPPLQAIDEAVGRCAEMDKPVIFPFGQGRFESSAALMSIAGLAVTQYVGSLCAQKGVEYIVTTGRETSVPIIEAALRDTYIAEGASEQFTDETVRFLSPNSGAMRAAVAGILRREQPAALVAVGAYYSEVSTILPTATSIDCMMIGGTPRMTQIPIFAALCDHVFLGEEIYAAEAYITGNPDSLAGLALTDILKVISLVLLAVGILGHQAGVNIVSSILGV